jgi:hypothetical protein
VPPRGEEREKDVVVAYSAWGFFLHGRFAFERRDQKETEEDDYRETLKK